MPGATSTNSEQAHKIALQTKHTIHLIPQARMPSLTSLTTLLTILTSTLAASIKFHNTTPSPICYVVQLSAGTFPTTTSCTSTQGIQISGAAIMVPAGQTITTTPSPDFDGAITLIRTDGRQGVRNEFTFNATATIIWYDTDYENGMSDGTLGPASHQLRIDGGPSLAGEQNTLGKAAAGWAHATNKAELLADGDYLRVGADGKLNWAYMDINAPPAVVDFFQNTADFNGYVNSHADKHTWTVGTMDMEIVAY